MTKTFRIVAVLVAVQALILVVYVGTKRARDVGPIPAYRLSRPAPDLVLRSADGSTSRISDLRGSAVVLHLWATWCPPCREELPSLFGFAELGTAEVLAVSVDPEWDPVQSFVANESIEYVRLASPEAVSDAFGVDDLPQTFVIDPAGILRLHFRGSRDWDSRELRGLIAEFSDS